MASGLFGHVGRSSSKNLVEFRAGKMTMKGTTVTPDKRKGLVYIYHSDDSLMHFCWKDRGTGNVEDDLIIFPDDIEYKRVKQCTTGRVFILKFKSSTRKFFFWMQEPKTDKDEEYSTKVNNLLNNPPTPGSGGSGSGLPPALAGLSEQLGDGQLQGLLGNLDQQQLLQLLSGYGGLGGHGGLSSAGSSVTAPTAASPTPTRVQSSPGPRRTSSASSSGTTTPRPATATPSVPPAAPSRPTQPPARNAVQLTDLQNILSNIQVPAESAEQASRENVDLSRVFTPDSIMPLLSDPEFRQQLAPFLPAGEELPQSPTELSSTLRSPQFQQALGLFSSALQSGQLGPLMGQFGFNEEVMGAARRGDMVEFVRAVQESSRPSTTDSTSTSDATSRTTTANDGDQEAEEKDKDEDEAMSLD
ncbi:proteasomal ubiquitin receptor ADRM1-like [Stylophora pistillata]|uniref:proteasomal ubiquitin receptor ADRM1-like n=1 Tax=Stylophora pistillata TaxID=50429 RepID=UPI000C04992F|nr:proteasomal ubiquitin receptor ADRM1-like [Stylophora pistillata]